MIVYAPAADCDVARLHDWLLERSPSAAKWFSMQLQSAERRISARPRAFRLLNDGETRRHSFRINRTTYLVDYLIEPDQIVVVRVWHGRQDRPG